MSNQHTIASSFVEEAPIPAVPGPRFDTLPLDPKLLRAVQEREIDRLGGVWNLMLRLDSAAYTANQFGNMVGYSDVSETFVCEKGSVNVGRKGYTIYRQGKPVSKDVLADQIVRLDQDLSPDAMEIYVHRLRKKLAGSGVAILTLRGLGYMLDVAR